MRVYSYTIDGSNHCKEGWAVETDDGALRDTYWGSDRSRLSKDEISSAVFQFDTDDFEVIERNSLRETTAEWMRYAPEDRKHIPSQNGLVVQWFVRKGAGPDLATEVSNQREAVEQAESWLRGAQLKLIGERDKLSELLAKVGESAEAQPADGPTEQSEPEHDLRVEVYSSVTDQERFSKNSFSREDSFKEFCRVLMLDEVQTGDFVQLIDRDSGDVLTCATKV